MLAVKLGSRCMIFYIRRHALMIAAHAQNSDAVIKRLKTH